MKYVTVVPSVIYDKLVKDGHINEKDFDPERIRHLEEANEAVTSITRQLAFPDLEGIVEKIYNEPTIGWNEKAELVVDGTTYQNTDIRKLIPVVYNQNKTNVKRAEEFLYILRFKKKIEIPTTIWPAAMSPFVRALPYAWVKSELIGDEPFKSFDGYLTESDDDDDYIVEF
jgi:hypothetical protein